MRTRPAPPSPSALSCPRIFACLLVAGFLLAPAGAHAAPATCREGNLLDGLAPMHARAAERVENLTDGLLCLEGQGPENNLTTRIGPGGGVAFDLGAEYDVEGVVAQSGGALPLRIAVSPDGKDWTDLTLTPPSGAMTTHRGIFKGEGRYVGISAVGGGGAAYVGELQLYCAARDDVAPPLRFRQGQEVLTLRSAFNVRAIRCALLALFALVLLGAKRAVKHERRVGMALLLASGLVWGVQSGVFRAEGAVQIHDTFHYLMGSRYFPELGYTRLYTCALQAEQALDPTTDFSDREIRDLTNDAILPATEVLAGLPPRCGRFTEARWDRFVQDASVFKGLLGPLGWKQALVDHGYNPPPAWTLVGGLMGAVVPTTFPGLRLLGLVDVMLYTLCAGLLVWSFRWRAAGLVAVLWTIGWPWEPAWTAGAFFRTGWLFTLVLGVSALKKERPLLAGLALGVSTQLRIFPVFTAGLVALHMILAARQRGWGPARRFLAGGALALLLVAPAAGYVTGGLDGYRDFRANIEKHERTPSSNKLGLGTLLTWLPGHTMEDLHDWRDRSPDFAWETQVAELREQRRPLLWGLRIASLGLAVAVAAGASTPSSVAVLGLGLCMTLTDLSCYYYAFAPLFGLLVGGDRRREALLISLFALTQFLPRLPASIEVPYLLTSLLFMVLWVWLAVRALRARNMPGTTVT